MLKHVKYLVSLGVLGCVLAPVANASSLVTVSLANITSPTYVGQTYHNVKLVLSNPTTATGSLYINGLSKPVYPEGFTPIANGDTCVKVSLLPGANCSVTGTFVPTQPGTHTWSTNIIAENYLWTIPDTANVEVIAAPTEAPSISFSVPSFATPIYNNRTYSDVRLVVTNTASTPLILTALYDTKYPIGFQQTDTTCTKVTLPAGGTCTVTGTFISADVGTSTWSAKVNDNEYLWPTTFTPASVEVVQGEVGLSIDQIDSLNKVIAYTNQTGTGTITLENNGTSDAIDLSATISNVAGASIAPGTCSSVLAVGNSCTFIVSYKPTTSISGFSHQTATVTVSYSNSFGLQEVAYIINLAQVNLGQFIPVPVYKNVTTGLPSSNVTSINKFGDVLYATTDTGLAISDDKGAHWKVKTILDGLGSNNVNSVYVSGDTIYVATAPYYWPDGRGG
jgi:hypothetical protein